jgi:peptidoglycan hydrolase-like protein with peptidoglycan-binding domain
VRALLASSDRRPEKAARRFQKRAHLAADGIVGPHTWQLLVVESQGRG